MVGRLAWRIIGEYFLKVVLSSILVALESLETAECRDMLFWILEDAFYSG